MILGGIAIVVVVFFAALFFAKRTLDKDTERLEMDAKLNAIRDMGGKTKDWRGGRYS